MDTICVCKSCHGVRRQKMKYRDQFGIIRNSNPVCPRCFGSGWMWADSTKGIPPSEVKAAFAARKALTEAMVGDGEVASHA